MEEYADMNIEELDKIRDINMSMNVAIAIATKMIEISMDSGDVPKNLQAPPLPKKKP